MIDVHVSCAIPNCPWFEVVEVYDDEDEFWPVLVKELDHLKTWHSAEYHERVNPAPPV